MLPYCTHNDGTLSLMTTGLANGQDSFLEISGLLRLSRAVLCDLCVGSHSGRWGSSLSFSSRLIAHVVAGAFVSAIPHQRKQEIDNKPMCCLSRVVLYSPIATIKNDANTISWNRILLPLLLDLLTGYNSPAPSQQRLHRHHPNFLRSVPSLACF